MGGDRQIRRHQARVRIIVPRAAEALNRLSVSASERFDFLGVLPETANATRAGSSVIMGRPGTSRLLHAWCSLGRGYPAPRGNTGIRPD